MLIYYLFNNTIIADPTNSATSDSLASAAPNRSQDMSFGSEISNTTFDLALKQAENVLNESSSSEHWPTPGQRHSIPREEPMQQTPPQQQQEEINDSYSQAVQLTDMLKHKALNSQAPNGQDMIPTYGRSVPGASMLNIYVRILLTIPGELVSKNVTNPYVIQTFKLAIPNTFARPWFQDLGFITSLVSQARKLLEQTFPFPHFKAFQIMYKVDCDSIFYNYVSQGVCIVHRIDMKVLQDMDPTFRTENFAMMTPAPISYNTRTAQDFDALYEISFLCYGVQQAPVRTLPPNQNELLFLTELNALVTTKLDALGSISKVLQLYHDYRNTVLRNVHRSSTTDPVFSKPTEPQRFQGQIVTPINNIVIEQTPLQPQTQEFTPVQPEQQQQQQFNSEQQQSQSQPDHSQTQEPHHFPPPPAATSFVPRQPMQVYIPPILRHQEHRTCPEAQVQRLRQNTPINTNVDILIRPSLPATPLSIHQQQQQQYGHRPMLPMQCSQLRPTAPPPGMPRLQQHQQLLRHPLRQPNARQSPSRPQKHPRVQILDARTPWNNCHLQPQ